MIHALHARYDKTPQIISLNHQSCKTAIKFQMKKLDDNTEIFYISRMSSKFWCLKFPFFPYFVKTMRYVRVAIFEYVLFNAVKKGYNIVNVVSFFFRTFPNLILEIK